MASSAYRNHPKVLSPGYKKKPKLNREVDPLKSTRKLLTFATLSLRPALFVLNVARRQRETETKESLYESTAHKRQDIAAIVSQKPVLDFYRI